jgi:hypothetical protein
MHPSNPLRIVRVSRLAVVAAFVAAVMAITGSEAATHGHVPVLDGWHDAAPHGAKTHGDGLSSCSICRLAHETAFVPLSPGTVSRPLHWTATKVEERSVPAIEMPDREPQPRAPPCLASC